MQNREFDTGTETEPRLSRQVVKRQRDEHEARDANLPQRDSFVPVISGIGDASSAGVHASMLNRATKGQPFRAARSLLRLQRQYGNRYVQRVLALARKGTGEAEVAPEVEQSIQQARGGGHGIDSRVRRQMESAFGTDFGNIRLHTDAPADTLNRELNARAFTTGQDIFFRQGAYNPGSSSGRELIAHELTHVVQQQGVVNQPKLSIGQPGDVYEREADKIAKEIIQRQNDDAEEGLTSDRVIASSQQTICTSSNGMPAIQLRQRQVYFVSGRPRENESTAIFEPEYLNQALTTPAYLAETRGMSGGRNVAITGHASKEAPRNLSHEEQREFNVELSRRRAEVTRKYLQDTENLPTNITMLCVGDKGAEVDIPIWRRVDLDVEEEERETAEETGEELWVIGTTKYPTAIMAYEVDTDWGYGPAWGWDWDIGQMVAKEDGSKVSFSATANIERTSNEFANVSFTLEVTDFRDEIDDDTHISTFGGSIGMRVQDGNLVLDNEMEIQGQNVSIAGDLVVRAGFSIVENNKYKLLVHVFYVNKKQLPDGGGGLSVSVLGSGGGITAPSGTRGGGSVAHTFVCGTLTIELWTLHYL